MMRLTKAIAVLIFTAFVMLAMPAASTAQVAVGVSIRIGPPALPVYAQPICPGEGYIWTPGYWAYGPAGYFWVPGTWVIAPRPGFLWTPGYWGWGGGVYVWHAGYWGPHVGFYGGINYGYGYTGAGFYGGEWRGGVFHYNTAYSHVNTTIIHNTYVNNTVVNTTLVNRVSYNGGTGGVIARPTANEEAAMREHHVQATSLQSQHEQMARTDHTMLASYNHGRPTVAATARPGSFHGEGVVGAHDPHMNNERANPNADVRVAHTDRPPNARTNETYSHSAERPQSTPHSENAQQNQYQSNPNHGTPNHTNNVQGNGQHTEYNHANSSHPPQPHQENQPPEHQAHPGGGHEGHSR